MTTTDSKGRALFPRKNAPASDEVLTPLHLARRCVQVLAPCGHVLEPCAGPQQPGERGLPRRGGFYEALREAKDAYDPFDEDAAPGITRVSWCEMREGLNFFDEAAAPMGIPLRWVITNPPFSKLTSFLNHAGALAPNVAFLCHIPAVFFTARLNAAREHSHAIRNIWRCEYPPEWTLSKAQGGAGVKCGMELGLVWWQRGYSGPIAWATLPGGGEERNT